MPVYVKPPVSDLVKPPDTSGPDIVSHGVKTNLINTKNIPLESIIGNISGSAWSVNYYFQVLGADDSPAPIDLSTGTITTQLRKVSNQELRVTDALAYSPDDETHENGTTGSANIVGSYKPNIGDVFVAGVREGYEGIFSITEVHPLSSFGKTGYSITYSFYSYVDTNPVLYNALEEAVVARYTFYEEYGGRKEAILDTELTEIVKLKGYITHYTRRLAEEFLDRDTNVLFVPGLDAVYDMFMTSFIRRTTDIDDSPLLGMMHVPVVDESYSRTTETIFDAIIGRSVLTYKTCKRNMGVVPSYSLKTTMIGHSAFYSGVRGVVYPTDRLVRGIIGGPWPALDSEAPEAHTPGLEFYRPNRDGFYIFSEYFYNDDKPNMSLFELMVMNVISNTQIATRDILDLFDKLLSKDSIYIFYYAPIICIIARMVVNRY